MIEAQMTGGSAADQAAVLQAFADYLAANAVFDWDKLESNFSAAPDCVFFNLNGHTYKGREHWTRLWRHLQPRVKNGDWVPYDVGGTIADGLAVVWCERTTEYTWVAAEPLDAGRKPHRSYISRSTMVFRKEADGWRVIHVHFSEASEGARPGGV